MKVIVLVCMIVMQFEYDKTYTYTIENISFGNFLDNELNELFRDGRISSHFMERDLSKRFNLNHVSGCKDHDLDPCSF